MPQPQHIHKKSKWSRNQQRPFVKSFLCVYLNRQREKEKWPNRYELIAYLISTSTLGYFKYPPDPDEWTEALYKEPYFCYVSP
jgi:hypothetical protein